MVPELLQRTAGTGSHSAVKDTHDQDAQISVSLETLVRRVTEGSLKELAALRAAVEQQISDVEARLEASTHQAAIDATVNTLINEKSQLAAALDKSQAQLLDVQARLKSSQQKTEELAVECVDLHRRLKDVAVSQTLRQEREQIYAIAAALPMRDEPADARAAAPGPAPASAVSPPKQPLQFSEKARDAKRVKIRRGIQVSVDGIPGELVDLSIGGAQAALRQLVKPNQLVQLTLPTAAGQLICKGRIVWAIYEQPGTSLSVYRTGVKFTDVDAVAVETFMADFCEKLPVQSRRSSGIA